MASEQVENKQQVESNNKQQVEGDSAAAEGDGQTKMGLAKANLGQLLFLFVLVIFFLIGAAKGSDACCLFIGVVILFLVVGELLYSRLLSNYIFKLSDEEVTPPHEPDHEGDPDYHATPAYILWGHHWTSITGAAPIVGPAQAAFYGWLPGMLWVVFGCLFSGAVHDFSTLVVSARNGGRSIADLGGYIVSWRTRILFLLLINFLCMLVVAKFMELIAKLFILWPASVLPVWSEVPLAIGLGFVARHVTNRYGASKARGVVLVLSFLILLILYLVLFGAVQIEKDAANPPVFGFKLGPDGICRDSVNWNRATDEYSCGFGAMQFWTIFLCIYAMIAAGLPVWVLLQPRDYINSHQLKVVMAALLLGLLIKAPKLDAEAVRSVPDEFAERNPVFPMMFTLIACGATSGFHGLVSSGVTSKQLNKMRDARIIGYSSMLGESTLSALVMVIVCSAGTWKATYATGFNWTGFLAAGGKLLEELGIDALPARTIMDVLVVSFASTTLDSGMRIQRILVGELGKSMQGKCPAAAKMFQNIFFQIIVSAVPSIYVANSRAIGAVWNLFGATNQLTACVSLLVCAVYVLRFRNFDWKYVVPFAVPIAWLLIMISWALINFIRFSVEDCVEKECDWATTIPIVPTVILSFIIALLVLAVYLEIAVYFFSGKYKKDTPVDPDNGKMEECKLCGPELHVGACC